MNRIGTQRIETERLILRPFAMEDAEAMFRNWASDPLVTEYLTWEPHRTVEDTRGIISLWISEYEKGDFFNWAIELKGEAGPIGSIGVVSVDDRVDAAEIGYCMSRALWGRGLMSEALRAVIDYLFDKAGMNRVAARHDARNPKSGRVMRKAGMTYEGTLRQTGKSNAGICDLVYYAILSADRKK
ncbi:MAG: GNAT family N-acetyltransferase [Clostridia bacterium]|nr:GNAT family N-acetyltransferase [Clostridia bacterium]